MAASGIELLSITVKRPRHTDCVATCANTRAQSGTNIRTCMVWGDTHY
jgi:hypothetical protein